MGSSLYKEAKTRHDKEIEKKRARGEDVSAEIAAHRHLAVKERRRAEHGNRDPSDVYISRAHNREDQSKHKNHYVNGLDGKRRNLYAKNRTFDSLNPGVHRAYDDSTAYRGGSGLHEQGTSGHINAKRQMNLRLKDYKKEKKAERNKALLRKGKMLAAGGALTAAGLGAYAYKKHLDKKREEANGKQSI